MATTVKNSYISVRVTPHEREKFKAEAKSAGMRTSEYARLKLLGEDPSPVVAAYSSLETRVSEVEEAIRKAQRFAHE